MADVFISYRRDDRAKAEALAKALKLEALDVWWDGALETGQTYDEKTQAALLECKSVLALWSPSAVKSEWVRAECTVGRERGVLVPVMIRNCVIPVPFNVVQTADLTGWNGDRSHPAYLDVVKQLKANAGKAQAPPLKPPPNRQMRALWRALTAVAVLAAIGASLWVFRPWEAMITANDPAVKAQHVRDASLANLVQFGVTRADMETLDWRLLVKTRFKKETYADLVKLAETGDRPAQALLCAVSYWGVYSGHGDHAYAKANCRRAAEAGEPIAQTYYAQILTDDNDAVGSAEQYQKASAQGFVPGMLHYAYRLMRGDGTPVNAEKAIDLLKQAQAQGSVDAEFSLGIYTWQGRGMAPDHDAGLKLIADAASKGNVGAKYELANHYRDGAGVPKDSARAKALYLEVMGDAESDYAASARSALKEIDQQLADPAGQTPPP